MMRLFVMPCLLLLAAPAGAQDPARMSPSDIDALPTRVPHAVHAYGPAPAQFGQLRLPDGAGPFPVVVLIHGGCWTQGFATLRNTAPLASALAERGIATWNIEYRQLGQAGAGWPGTFQDWAAATDALRELAKEHPLDLGRVLAAGHSAGAHAALWLAARPGLPEGSEIRGGDPLPLKAAVAIDGPGDLAAFVGIDEQICGAPVIRNLMGGGPDDVPARYAEGSPAARLPLGTPQLLVSASPVLPPEAAQAYADRAGGEARVLALAGAGHFGMIAPATAPGRQLIEAIEAALASPDP